MKIIGRYSTFIDSLGTIPENSLMVLEICHAAIDTFDRSALDDNSKCHIKLITANGRNLFAVGYPNFDRNMSRALAEQLIEELATKKCVDLREYDGIMLYGGSESVYTVESVEDRYM